MKKRVNTMGLLGITSEPMMFLYAIAFMINYTVIPQLLLEKVCLRENHNNQTICNGSGVSIGLQKKASIWWFYLLTSSLLPSTFTVLIWGPLTDRIGRKKGLMFVALIDTIRSLVNLINSFYITAHPAYLIFGSILPCFHGDIQGVLTICYAYIADVTVETTNKRTTRMALVEGSMFISGIIAGLLSGYTLQIIGYVPVFIISLTVDMLMLCYTCCLPVIQVNMCSVDESECILNDCSADEDDDKKSLKQPDQRMPLKPKKESKVNPLKYVTKAFDIIINPNNSHRVIIPMVCAFGVTIIAIVGERVVQTLYLKNKPFYFSPEMIGYYTAVQAGVRGIGVVFITQILHRLFKVDDYILIIIGLLSQILVFVLTGLSDSVLSVYLVCIAGICVPIPLAAIRSVITKAVPANKYGTVLASVSAADAFGSFVTNTVSLWMYDLTLTIYSGTVYFGICTFSLIALAIVVTTYIKEIIECPRSGYQSI